MVSIPRNKVSSPELTTSQKQRVFSLLVARLIIHAYSLGYEITFGEAYRAPGTKSSLHPKRLAIDLNLFKDGRYLEKTEDHAILGTWWELQSTAQYTCAWGGRFEDGNHYSITDGGVR